MNQGIEDQEPRLNASTDSVFHHFSIEYLNYAMSRGIVLYSQTLAYFHACTIGDQIPLPLSADEVALYGPITTLCLCRWIAGILGIDQSDEQHIPYSVRLLAYKIGGLAMAVEFFEYVVALKTCDRYGVPSEEVVAVPRLDLQRRELFQDVVR